MLSHVGHERRAFRALRALKLARTTSAIDRVRKPTLPKTVPLILGCAVLRPSPPVIRIGLKEMVKFCKTFYDGIDDNTFLESCGVADLITTCTRPPPIAFAHRGDGWSVRTRCWSRGCRHHVYVSCACASFLVHGGQCVRFRLRVPTGYGGRNRKCAEAFAAAGKKKSLEEIEAELLGGQKLQGTLTAKEVNHILKMKGLEHEFPFFTTVYKISYEDTPLSAITETPY